jgi:type VI secretion system protein ImpJ
MNQTDMLPDPVQWAEGMLLSPQHLQQDHIYWRAQLRQAMAGLNPHFAGVVRLALQRPSQLAATGVLCIDTLDCVLPDGTPIRHPGAAPAAQPLALDVGSLMGAADGSLRVYLVLRRSQANVSMGLAQERRYGTAYATEDADENTGSDGLPVFRQPLHYVLAAYPRGTLPPANLCACPLLEIVRDARGALAVGEYHPPMLRLDASDFLGANGLRHLLADMTDLVWRKTEELGGHSGPGPDGGLRRQGGGELASAARVLATALPLLTATAQDPALHPAELYRTVSMLVGQVCNLGAWALPPRMPAYSHHDCIGQFREAVDFIVGKLDGLHSNYERYPFSPFKEGFSRRLLEDMDGDVVVELVLRPGQDIDAAAAWLFAADIASADMLPIVQQQRQRGGKAEPLGAAEARKRGLPADAALFLLKNARIHSTGAPAFRANAPLMIQGVDASNIPAGLYFYRPTAGAMAAARPARMPEHAHA